MLFQRWNYFILFKFVFFFAFHYSNRDIDIKLIVVSVWVISLILIKRLIAADVAIESIIISENPMWYGAPMLSGSIIDTSDIHIQIIVSYFVAESSKFGNKIWKFCLWV